MASTSREDWFKQKYIKYFRLDKVKDDDFTDSSVFEKARKKDPKALLWLFSKVMKYSAQAFWQFLGPDPKWRRARISEGHLEDFFNLCVMTMPKCLKRFNENKRDSFEKQLNAFTYYYRKYLDSEGKQYNRVYQKKILNIEDFSFDDNPSADDRSRYESFADEREDNHLDLLRDEWVEFCEWIAEDFPKKYGKKDVTVLQVFYDYSIEGLSIAELMSKYGLAKQTALNLKDTVYDYVKEIVDEGTEDALPISPDDLETVLKQKPDWAKDILKALD